MRGNVVSQRIKGQLEKRFLMKGGITVHWRNGVFFLHAEGHLFWMPQFCHPWVDSSLW